MLPTASVPNTFSYGAASTGISFVAAGDFRDLIMGNRLGARVEVLRERHAGNYQYGFLAHLRFDAGHARPASFHNVKGVST